jgi:NAD(P)-dependent dehydrogenase (short-subunit alcohol dehydrogenase family)
MGILDGRVVIVTGAGRGLGRSHALHLASEGATVVVNDLNVTLQGEAEQGPSPAEEVAAEIEATGGTAIVNGDSVTDWEAMRRLIAGTVERFGDLHAVVNNAGFLRDRMITSMTEQEFDSVIEVHLKGTFCVLKHACDHWRSRGKAGEPVSGRIVNTTSGSGLFANVGQANYGSAKSAIATLSQVTALEMQRYGVTCNAVSPIAATRMLATIGRVATEGRWDPLDPANMSPLVAWLCSEESGWLSGQVLRVDGNKVQRVAGWAVEGQFESAGGQAVEIGEIGPGLRKLYGTLPAGLVIR